jgi:DNA-binding PadR family transcriptional regulator
MPSRAPLVPGTLGLLVRKAASPGPPRSYGILLYIGQISRPALLVETSSLYPAVSRSVRRGLLNSSLGTSENHLRSKFYKLHSAGRERLREEAEGWNRLVSAVASVLGTQPEQT